MTNEHLTPNVCVSCRSQPGVWAGFALTPMPDVPPHPATFGRGERRRLRWACRAVISRYDQTRHGFRYALSYRERFRWHDHECRDFPKLYCRAP